MKTAFPPARESNVELLRGIFFEPLHLGDQDLFLETLLGAFGCPLGSLGAPLGIPWRPLGPPWGPLGTFLGPFSALWGAMWTPWPPSELHFSHFLGFQATF